MKTKTPNCCPDNQSCSSLDGDAYKILPAKFMPKHEQVDIDSAEFVMGDHFFEGYYSDGETPLHKVKLDRFSIDSTPVTNAQFSTFVEDTRYQTEAERSGNSAVFHQNFVGKDDDIIRKLDVPWWLSVQGAHWRQPHGKNSTIEGLLDHPVVHISHKDALAYCLWSSRALPTEAQWEYAARGGLAQKRFPWGDVLEPDGQHCANLWQGHFPNNNDASDGFVSTAPVKSFEPNNFGLWQMVGNVWEWCADWFSPSFYKTGSSDNPTGPARGTRRVKRGGSYLCHASYCNRYRVAARSSATPLTSAENIGFRTTKF